MKTNFLMGKKVMKKAYYNLIIFEQLRRDRRYINVVKILIKLSFIQNEMNKRNK